MQKAAAEIRPVQTQRRFYQEVPEEQIQRLEEFRRENPYRRIEANGQTWEYLCLGEGSETVLLLPGAMGTGESAWQTAHGLAESFRVVVPSYPPVATMAELVDGIVAVLDAVPAARVHVIGGSYGGFVAQVFVRRHPQRAASLVISHSGAPDPARSRSIRSAVRLLRLLPMPLVRILFRRSMGRLLPQGHPESAFQAAYFEEVVATQLRKRSLLAGYERTIDLDENYIFSPADLAGWTGRVLLVLSDDDPGVPETARSALAALYPNSRLHLFSGTGHSAAILKREEYLALLKAFVRGEG